MKKVIVLAMVFSMITFYTYYHHSLGGVRNRMKLTSQAFKHEEELPEYATSDGQGVNPPLAWTDIPDKTKSFALIVDDPDAPQKTFVHWVVYNIPSRLHKLEKNQDMSSIPDVVVGTNSAGKQNYFPASPPSGRHRYFFKLYALKEQLPDSLRTAEEVMNYIKRHELLIDNDAAILMGTYERQS